MEKIREFLDIKKVNEIKITKEIILNYHMKLELLKNYLVIN